MEDAPLNPVLKSSNALDIFDANVCTRRNLNQQTSHLDSLSSSKDLGPFDGPTSLT